MKSFALLTLSLALAAAPNSRAEDTPQQQKARAQHARQQAAMQHFIQRNTPRTRPAGPQGLQLRNYPGAARQYSPQNGQQQFHRHTTVNSDLSVNPRVLRDPAANRSLTTTNANGHERVYTPGAHGPGASGGANVYTPDANGSRWRNRNDHDHDADNGHGREWQRGNWFGKHHDWERTRRSRAYWTSHYDRFALFGGGYYYWDSGYWYPAYGYDPTFNTYAYNAPIYSYQDQDPGQVIVNVQGALQEQGYYRGELDGTYGPMTREALLGYQRDNGLPETGEIDDQTLSALGFN
ncbi:MAG: peptidoglycan-binding protein [Verrucomicrobiota bacterium]|nr:peptidoglycan-binding protein [Verrucomicrobiota bacterium]